MCATDMENCVCATGMVGKKWMCHRHGGKKMDVLTGMVEKTMCVSQAWCKKVFYVLVYPDEKCFVKAWDVDKFFNSFLFT